MIPRLHLVTDDAVLGRPEFTGQALAVMRQCGAGVALHIRGPGVDGRRLHDIGVSLVDAGTDAWLIVNDRIDVALAVGAAGVQLGARSLAVADARGLVGDERVIGRSVHDDDDAATAARDGADYLVRGTIFPSASHPGRPAAGVDAVRGCVERVAVPVIAIGGVTPARVDDLARAGAYGVAVLGGIWNNGDAAKSAAIYLEAVDSAWHSGESAS